MPIFFLENEAGTSKLQRFTAGRRDKRLQQIRAPCFGHKRSLGPVVAAEAPFLSCCHGLPGLFIVPDLAGLYGTSKCGSCYGALRIFFLPLEKMVRNYFSWKKGAFSNEDLCRCTSLFSWSYPLQPQESSHPPRTLPKKHRTTTRCPYKWLVCNCCAYALTRKRLCGIAALCYRSWQGKC